MANSKQAGRRSFLKASLALGTANFAIPTLGQAAGPPGSPQAPAPTAERAHAEAGGIDGEPHHERGVDGALRPELITDPGSDFMVDLMRAVDIRYVAAMAGSTFRGLHESIVNYGGNRAPELIVCVHEEVSAAMAHGYAKVAGKPMACLVHSNVGLQHASMAIYNAWCDRVPMIVVAGNGLDATKRRPGVEWLHATQDLGAMVRDFVKWDDVPVSLAHYAESFMRGYELSTTPPYEPVLIVADSELQEAPIVRREALNISRRAPVSPPAGDPAAIDRAAALLVAAEKPLIVVDRVARTPDGVKLLVQLAEMLNAPVIDRAGRMNMPTTHYLNQSSLQSRLVGSSDVLLGLELTDIWGIVNTVPDRTERTFRRLAHPSAKVIGISANYGYIKANVQDVQRYYAADLTMAADAQTCLPQLIEAVDRRLTRDVRKTIGARTAALKADYVQMRAADATDAARAWDASPVSTARLSMELWDQIKHLDWGLVSNPAFISSWPQRLWDITEHHQFIGGEGGYGVGYGAPAAAGAALAHRDAGRIAVAVQNDGDLMVLPGTLWTLAHHSIPILMVMHNNRAWHQETMHLKRMSSRRERGPDTWGIGTVITDPAIDFAMMARSMGVWADGPISDPDRLKAAIGRALEVVKSGKPALLDVLTQPR